MSASQQAKASRRKQRNGYAHMGGAMNRPRMKGAVVGTSVKEAIEAERRKAQRIANASKK